MRRLGLVILSLGACRADAPPPQPRSVEPATAPHVEADPAPAPDEERDSAEVHGALKVVDGQRVLRVWGTPRQMGHAQGALLRGSIIDVLEGYALDVITPSQLDAAATLYGTIATIPPSIREEAEGIVEGMKAAGGARIERLDRDLTGVDLLVMGAMTDLVAIGCSSLSAWGASTEASLHGDPMVVRNLDWSDEPALLRNQVVVVYQPQDEARQPVVSVSFAGYLGCLSCMNEAGVTTLFNMGYGEGAASLVEAATGFSPANMLIRDVLQRGEVDGGDDVESALREATHAGSYILHVLEPSAEPPARILEVEADGVHVRQPGLGGASTVLAATNHLRGKEGPQTCRRYDTIARTSRARSHRWDAEGLWALAREVRLPEVVHTILVQPRTRSVRVWFRQPQEGAHASSPGVQHHWESLVQVPSAP
ncbi:MAG: C45 family autoproteolytic acyltransferase/hydrolase [Nannocystaceae bacterium]|nr:C45 family autoproteolytic acyltransferase/hydrolase [bacterium]